MTTTNHTRITISTSVRNVRADAVVEGDIVLMHTLTGPIGTVDSFVCVEARLVGDDIVMSSRELDGILTTSKSNIISVVRTSTSA